MATKEFAFDIKLTCAIRVNAATEQEARAMLRAELDASSANLGAWPSGDPILCEVSLDVDAGAHLYEIDGEDVA